MKSINEYYELTWRGIYLMMLTSDDIISEEGETCGVHPKLRHHTGKFW